MPASPPPVRNHRSGDASSVPPIEEAQVTECASSAVRRRRIFTTVSRALLSVLAACVTAASPPPPAPEPPDAAPRAALERFLSAEKAGDFDAVYRLLSSGLRSRYTPARLQADYQRDEGMAQDKLARIRAALSTGTPLAIEGAGSAQLTLTSDRSVHLVLESDGWHVASLE
jgi:hypothetical protein